MGDMTITAVRPSTQPAPITTMTFERWLAYRPENRGIVPPWIDPDKAWPPMPGPTEDAPRGA